jgi:hypothetical protein
MDSAKIKTHLPTIPKYLEKRRKAKQNRLPKHLRPPEVWPIWLQLVLNIGILMTLWNLMIDKDDYLTEAAPAVILVVCFLFLIYTFISGFRLRRLHDKVRGQTLTKWNLTVMAIAFLFWAASIVIFIS